MVRFCVVSLLAAGACAAQPPVLHKYEPADSIVVALPGAKPASAAAPDSLPFTEVHLAPPAPDPERPYLRRPKREFPPLFEQDSADYLNQQIGIWQQVDAQVLLGEPLRSRPAFAEDRTVNGQILAFDDPTGRYRELELDFSRDTGLLRTLFVYPNSMTWQQCRQTFGGNVKSSEANKGRIFYSYLDRHLDVLVDSLGKVISLGMY
jgi:hypothetical protein